jgi:serine/threonine protein phosphatase 1
MILKRLFNTSGATQAPQPLTGTYIAVGDIHGHVDKLTALLASLQAEAATHPQPITLVCLGDYINRGPASAGVIATLRHNLPNGWNTIFLRGNHEQKLLEFLSRPEQNADWLGWGGVETCLSYGVKPYGNAGLRNAGAIAAELQEALTTTGDLAWLQATQLYHSATPYLFVHAGVRPGVPLKLQMENDLLYIREDWLNRPHGLNATVVFGHTIVEQPLVLPDRIGIDTGAYQGGPLTAAIITAHTAPTFKQA